MAATFCFGLSALVETRMYGWVDDPMRRIGRSRSRHAGQPSQGVELIKHAFNFASLQLPHGPVATLNITIRHLLQIMREDVPCDSGKPVLVIREPKDARIERDGMGQQKAVQEGTCTLVLSEIVSGNN